MIVAFPKIWYAGWYAGSMPFLRSMCTTMQLSTVKLQCLGLICYCARD